MTMEMKFCQSCGMPLINEIIGTNADGTPNEDYCLYCYKDGRFTQDVTMGQMIDHCARFTDEINRQSGRNLTEEQAKEMFVGVACCVDVVIGLCLRPDRTVARRSEFRAGKGAADI